MTDIDSNKSIRSVIRVFVSSTFSDMKHERNALQELVFPKLEQLCLEKGFQFQAIDLRWGVSSEAGQDHRTMRICFDELRRAQKISPRPNFLILLGDRYGWRPLPEEIPLDEFQALERAAEQAATADGRPTITVLRDWYRRDENAIPHVYVLQSRRQELRDGIDYTKEDGSWFTVQAVLWTIINEAMPPRLMERRFEEVGAAGEFLPSIVRFQASATEQEIWHGALRVPDAKDHVLAFYREIQNAHDFTDPVQIKDFVDVASSGRMDADLQAEQRRLKAELFKRLGESNVLGPRAARLVPMPDQVGGPTADVTKDHLVQLCADVEKRLTQIIEVQIDQYWGDTRRTSAERALRELMIEQDEHGRFGRERGAEDSFVGRQNELQAVLEYVHSESPWPLVVHGASGCGKTALLARAAQEAAKTQTAIVRFIGVMPRASNIRSLLSSLCQELRLRHPLEDELPTDVSLLREELHDHFRAATPDQPLILFIDALDQLADDENGRQLHWLPTKQLPSHVKLVVSCLSDGAEGDPSGQPFARLEQRQLPKESFLNLDPLSQAEARALLFDRWLPRTGRTVTQDQRNRIEQSLASAVCRQPIYLRLLFEEARFWRSYDVIPDIGEDVPSLLDQFFERLSEPTNHGPLLVDRVLGYLSASREGLAETEILELLFADPEYKSALDQTTMQTRHEMPPNANRIPVVIWSRLRSDLAPYLTERAATGANVLTFYHRQMADWARGHLGGAVDEPWQAHSRLADYFEKLSDPKRDRSWVGNKERPLLQLCFHLASAGQLDELSQTLCNLRFVAARCAVGQVFELIADYRLARESLPEAQPALIEKRQRDERAARWIEEIIDYARKCNEGQRSELPAIIPSIKPWSLERIRADCQRIMEHPTRLDLLNAFAGYVKTECYPLLAFGRRAGFVVQHAFNFAPDGPVHAAADQLCSTLNVPMGLRRWAANAAYNPHPALLHTLDAHRRGVQSVCVTPDGRYAVSGSGEIENPDPPTYNTLRVWDLESGACLRTFKGHGAGVQSVSVTPDGRHAVSGSFDETLRIWDLGYDACLQTLKGHAVGIPSVSVSPDGRRAVTGGADNTIRVWDLERGTCLRTLEGHVGLRGTVNGVNVTPDGRLAISGSGDKTLRIWDLESGACLRILEGHSGSVESVSLTPDGRRAVSGSMDNTIRIWDLESGACLRILEGHSGGVSGVNVTPDGRRAVSGSLDKTLRVWDLESGACLRTFDGHNKEIWSVNITPDGRRAVSGSLDKTLRVWDLESGMCSRDLDGRNVKVWGLTVTPNGRRAVSWHSDKTLQVLDLESGACLRTLDGSAGINHLIVTPNGRRAVSVNRDNTLRVWDLEGSMSPRTLAGHSGEVVSLCVTPDSQRAVSGSKDKTIRVWDLQSGACLHTFEGHNRDSRMNVMPDGRRAVMEIYDNTLQTCNLQIWDLESGACLRTLRGHRGGVLSVNVMPDGRSAVTGGYDNTIRIWDLESGVCLRVIEGHSLYNPLAKLSVAPDGRLAVSGSHDGNLWVWDLDNGACLRTLKGHGGMVESVRLTHDGRRALSVGRDKTIRVWDLGSGESICVYSSQAPISSVALVDRGAAICAVSSEGILFVQFRGIEPGTSLIPEASPDTSPEAHEQLLRRGLDFSRREKGPEDEETAGHLAALAAHFERAGQPAAAHPFAEEHARLAALIAEREHPEPKESYNPVLLSKRALELRENGEFLEAELLLSDALRSESKINFAVGNVNDLPHLMNNLTLVLLLRDKLHVADTLNREAWSLKQHRHDITSTRILFLRVVYCYRRQTAPGLFIGQLKTLLTGPKLSAGISVVPAWNKDKPFEFHREELPSKQCDFLTALVDALNDRSRLRELDRFPEWRDQPPELVEEEWPVDPDAAVSGRIVRTRVKSKHSLRFARSPRPAVVREPTIEESTRLADKSFRKGRWEAAEILYSKLLNEGGAVEEIGTQLVTCLLNMYPDLGPATLARIDALLGQIEEAGRVDIARKVRDQLAKRVKTRPRNRQWWRFRR
ncbi:MAG: DUF4062 domain-containing protein [Candidatus Eisenbacteria bacterium]|nr:DUF4062 domain-containing protein [Candidatus Eisenbacteria bacterium]